MSSKASQALGVLTCPNCGPEDPESNPFSSDKHLFMRLNELRGALLTRAAASPRLPPRVPRKPIPETLTLVLALAGQAMRAREIHAAGEALTGALEFSQSIAGCRHVRAVTSIRTAQDPRIADADKARLCDEP